MFEEPHQGEGLSPLSNSQLSQMFNESLYWQHERTQAFQRSQLEQLLRHAKAHVPFYKNRLDCVLKLDGSIAWENWEQIPIVTRADIRDRGQEMKATYVPPTHGRTVYSKTSGSTGVPIRIHNTELANHVASFARKRMMTLHQVPTSGVMAEFKASDSEGSDISEDFVQISKEGEAYMRFIINRKLTSRRKLEVLKLLGVTLLHDLPNHAEILARQNLELQAPVSVQWVLARGMNLTAFQEKLLAESFGAQCIVPYSSQEGSFMAFQCPSQRQNLHVCAEILLLECVDESGRQVAEGESGRSVITPFFNAAQPLIRYDQGDLLVKGSKCGCGITLPVLLDVSGRSDAVFHFSEGQVSPYQLDYELMQRQLSYHGFQLAQVAPSQLVLRYIANTDADAASCDVVRAHLLENFRVQADILFERVEDIPANAGGKQHRFVREI